VNGISHMVRNKKNPMEKKGGYEKCAHLYDLFDTKRNIEFFLHYAEKAEAVLDIGAGTGRVAIKIAESGIEVTCIEPSPAMRKVFEKKLKDKESLSERIVLHEGDACSFSLKRRFPAVFLSGTFDHFLDDEERFSALSNIHFHLREKGILIFDVFLGLMKDSPVKPAGTVKEGDFEYRRFVGNRRRDNFTMETHLVFEIYKKSKLRTRIEEFSLTGIIDRSHLHSILSSTGFTILKEYRDYDFTPYRESDPLLVIEAKKGK
jgi:SAM-dependent methyltransferase